MNKRFMKLPPVFYAQLTRLPRGLEILLLLLLLWQLAGLGWFVLSPLARHGNLAMPTPVPQARSYTPKALQGWFEDVQAPAAAAGISDLTLMAVVSGERGIALLNAGAASSVAVRVGDEIRPGSRLISVSANDVVIEQNGKRQSLELARKASGSASELVSVVSEVKAKPAAVAESTHDLTRGQLTGFLAGGNLADWSKGLSTYRDGGILVEDFTKQPLLQALRLRNGDVMKRVNGREIKQPADISLVYNQISQQTSVDMSVLRDGSLQTLHFKIKP